MEADIAISVALALVVAFIAAQIAKTLRTNAAQKTLREAISRGESLTPAMLAAVELAPEPGTNDLRTGMVMIAIALALAGLGLVQGTEQAIRGMFGIALFPLFVGIALLLRLRLQRGQGDA